ncbi:MAG: hypothetical protein VKL42_10550 [Snowella sp.]|nr:hypothetical protein [Snowella sp.]
MMKSLLCKLSVSLLFPNRSIKSILSGYFGESNLVLNMIRPKKGQPGGWTEVFKYCKSSEFEEAFEANDYIIIQIDTDVSNQKGYQVSPLDENGNLLDTKEFIAKVKEKLISLIGKYFYRKNAERIIFAIAVHSIECWLLPLYVEENKKSAIDSCFEKLAEAISKASEKSPSKKLAKKSKYYQKVSLPYSRKEILLNHYSLNPSFKIFIEELEAIKIPIND